MIHPANRADMLTFTETMTEAELDQFIDAHFASWVADRAARLEIEELYTDLGGEA